MGCRSPIDEDDQRDSVTGLALNQYVVIRALTPCLTPDLLFVESVGEVQTSG